MKEFSDIRDEVSEVLHLSAGVEDVATVPMYVEQDRPIVELDLRGPDGQARTVRCLVDTGGGALFITEGVAQELGLTWGQGYEGSQLAPVVLPGASIGGVELDREGARVGVWVGPPHDPGRRDEAFLGGQILARHHVIFDYPNRTFTIDRPGALVPQGEPVRITYPPVMGFPRLEAKIDGEIVGLLLDTGAACSMLSSALLGRLAERHPDWARTVGAVGTANMVGNVDPVLTLMRLGAITCGGVRFANPLVVERHAGNFEEYMTGMMTGPVVGALAGNALKQYRVEIDYANGVAYFEQLAGPDPSEMDLVGLVIRADADGGFIISGTASSCGYPAGCVQKGDRLVAIDGRPVGGLSRPEVLTLLRGVPGERRQLAIERDGQRVEVTLPVVRVL
ncbi:MAG TPA: PDZ domain-containing protein [Symbiobacteriaceae bacterium]|nr:PDZ domain-containing protein [Symbiobacteriaceae bacterium]